MKNPAPLPPPHKPPQETTHLLEINLISAQNLKTPSTNLRKLQTYAVVYIDSTYKLRTRIDRLGGDNPTWNDKFLFRVSDEFLRRDTSSFTVDIFAVGVIKDALLGSVRCYVSNVINPASYVTPSFIALNVRRSSGRCHGVLNVGGAVVDDGGETSDRQLSAVSAIGYVDMMGERRRRRRGHGRGASSGSGSWGGDSDGTESTESSNSSTTSSGVLRELNLNLNLAGESGRVFCGLGLGLGFQRKGQISLCEDDIKAFGALDLNS